MKHSQRSSASRGQVREAVESFLTRRFDAFPDTEVRRAAQYAVMGNGHRWRPIIAVAAGRIFRTDALEAVLPSACAIELVHSASLILDDLPSMDNALLRRGRAPTHKVFAPWAVDMVPIFLLSMANEICLTNPQVDHQKNATNTLELSRAVLDMTTGQTRDLEQDFGDHEEASILQCYAMKTGALFSIAAKTGAIVCGADKDDTKALADAGLNIGISYQLFDDTADVMTATPKTGKPTGMDVNKKTSVDLYNLGGARQRGIFYQNRAIQCLTRFGPQADWLKSLILDPDFASTGPETN